MKFKRHRFPVSDKWRRVGWKIARRLLLVVGIAWLVGQPAARAQAVTVGKIGGEVFAHQKTKARPAGVSLADHKAFLRLNGLNPDNETAEDCALYTTRRLEAPEIAELATRGIRVTPQLWIPPVPGKHANGFHLATVAFSAFDFVQADSRIVRLESTEFQSQPQNDLGIAMINADDVHGGAAGTPRTGNGIKIAVADSGVDLLHGDFPTVAESFDMTKGSSTADWPRTVANTVTPHGTHVSATALGRGTYSGGKYRGSAPGASFYFYKIGDDFSGSASTTDEIEAINRAVTVGAHVFTMSYGGTSTYMDGSEPMEQAIDAAVTSGVTVFVSAGNSGSAGLHTDLGVAPGGAFSSGFNVVNPSSGSSYTTQQHIRLIWRDSNPSDLNITASCSNLGAGESFSLAFSGSSPRGTEGRRYVLTPNLPPGGSKIYQIVLQNGATGSTPLVHCYTVSGIGTFTSPDSNYTVSSPAIADGAIAVGAWTQRRSWTNYQGSGFFYSDLTVGTLAPFSSRGPRIDGAQKPDLVAPGAATISARDSVAGLASSAALTIDNDGVYNAGGADYYVMRGTSMASPMAAGVAALILEARPTLTPAQVKQAMTSTASQAGSPDATAGYGLIDALGAVLSVSTAAPSITTQPTAQTVLAGGNATFTLVATGAPTPTFQWQRQPTGTTGFTNLSDGGVYGGVTTANLTITGATVAMRGDQFRCVVSNGVLPNATSSAVALTVNAAPVITSANNTTFVVGTAGTFTVTATGAPAPTFAATGLPAWATLNATTGVLSGTPPNTSGAPFALSLTASNGISPNATQSFTLNVQTPQPPSIISQPLSRAVQTGGTATFSVAATGTGTLTYQWYFTAVGTTTPQAVAGATSATLTLTNVQPASTGDYVCVVTNAVNPPATSNAAQLVVAARIVRVAGQSAAPGTNVVVPLQLLANGDENGVTCSVNFDPIKLAYVDSALGTDAATGSLVRNTGQAGSGALGFVIAKPSGQAFAAGTRNILNLTFTVTAAAASGDVLPLLFSDGIIGRGITSTGSAALPGAFVDGSVVAASGLEGDVNGDGVVDLSDWVKLGRYVVGLDPPPVTGVGFTKSDCAPRAARGDGAIDLSDWVQAGRFVVGLDTPQSPGGPSSP